MAQSQEEAKKTRNSRSDRLRQVLCARARLLARVLRAHVASVEDATAELTRVDGDIVAIGRFAGDPSSVFDHLLVCTSAWGQRCTLSRLRDPIRDKKSRDGKKRQLTAFAGRLCDEAAHRKDDRRRRARVDATRERDKKAAHTGPAEIVPQPASRAVPVRSRVIVQSVI